jgi:hypothetical protein
VERVITDSCVTDARRVVDHGLVTHRIVFETIYIRLERAMANGIIEGTRAIGEECEGTDCGAIFAGRVA